MSNFSAYEAPTSLAKTSFEGQAAGKVESFEHNFALVPKKFPEPVA